MRVLRDTERTLAHEPRPVALSGAAAPVRTARLPRKRCPPRLVPRTMASARRVYAKVGQFVRSLVELATHVLELDALETSEETTGIAE
jgi:hypothetical protein